MEAANSTSVETQVTSALPSEAPVISTSPTETDPPKAAPVKVKDLKLNNKVTIQVSIGAKACCLRKITANKKCTKIIIPEKIEGIPITSIEYNMKNDDYTTYNIFGVRNNNSDCDEAASDEEWIKSNNTNIKEIVLPNTIKTVADSAFQGLTGLKKINLPKQLTEIKKYTFARCIKLKRIDVPQYVRDIDMRAFDLCHNLSRIHIKKGSRYFIEKSDVIIRKADMSMFMFSTENKKVVIPKEVKKFEDGAFSFFKPQKLSVSKKNKYIKLKNHCIYDKKTKSLVAIMSDKKKVVRIPNGVKTLAKKICCMGYVNRIIIPKSVKYWCDNWCDNILPEDSVNGTCIIELKGKNMPVIKGDANLSISWYHAYRFEKKYAKAYCQFFKMYGKPLRWSKICKAYVCKS